MNTPDAINDAIDDLAARIEWLAIAQALVLIHGHERAWQRLRQLGCPYVVGSR